MIKQIPDRRSTSGFSLKVTPPFFGRTAKIISCLFRLLNCSSRLLTWSFSGSALLCNVCESRVSWEDCEKNRMLVNCSNVDEEFDVCFKVHRATKIENSEKHIFTKGCGYQDLCSGEQCVEFGDWCLVDCCNVDQCNASPSVEATYFTHLLAGIVMFLHFDWILRVWKQRLIL